MLGFFVQVHRTRKHLGATHFKSALHLLLTLALWPPLKSNAWILGEAVPCQQGILRVSLSKG